MNDKLELCPICGKQVEAGNFSGVDWFVYCECGIEFAPQNVDTLEELAARWNRRASGWIKCKDEPMPSGVLILAGMWLANGDWYQTQILVCDTDRSYLTDGDGNDSTEYSVDDYTHWMPLPDPPEVEE